MFLVFPAYDSDGRFMSLGNIEARTKARLLFIDFEKPRRMRREGPMLESYPGAKAAVEVTVERVWQNCPRYVHRMQLVEPSPYVPRTDGSASSVREDGHARF
jgi:hypothetical protein